MNNKDYSSYLFDKVKKLSFSNPGVTRETYGKGENLTHKFLIQELKKYTHSLEIDYGGNFLALYKGRSKKVIVIGSHLDSQKHGGNFDGLAGVIMGMTLIKTLRDNDVTPYYSIGVMGIRGEESCWFPYSYIGSKIAVGQFDKKLLHSLKRSDTGKSLYYHINKSGFNAKKVEQGKIKFDVKNIKYFIEPHIEQGPVLERKKIPLGIVTGIRGSFRFRNAKCVGEYLHSGATPMDYRKDAVVAVSSLVNEMNLYWKDQLKKGVDLTVTFGQFYTDNEEHSFAKSAGLVNFCIDVRSNSKKVLETTKKQLLKKINKIEKNTKTKIILGKETNSAPAIMNKKLVKIFNSYSKSIGTRSEIMASGAGHDSSIFANYGIPSLMLFIRNKNGSHNPNEFMDIKYFIDVFKVLHGVITKKCDCMYDLKKHYLSNKKEILSTINKVLNSGTLEMGDEVEQFEENFSKFCGANYCVTVSSGSMGLLIALKALDLNNKDEVITVANSDIPTSHAISLAGANIKWSEVCEETFNLNSENLNSNINKNTKAILPVHLFGNPADIIKINLIAKKFNLSVIEDGCLATGAEFNDKKIGCFSDMTVFSTNPGKVLDGIGPGGIITTNKKSLYLTLKKLRDYGRESRPSKWPVKSHIIGYNSKMSSINAAVLNIRLKYLEDYIAKRNENAQLYKCLLDSKKIKFQTVLQNAKSAWRNFPIRVKNRNKIYSSLFDKGLKVSLGYLPINYKDACYNTIKNTPRLKITEKISSEIINLPCHPYMSHQEIIKISKNILSLI